MKRAIITIVCAVLWTSAGAQDRLRVFVAHTHTGTDQIGQMYALEINQQLRTSLGYIPVAVPQDADVMLMLTSIDPDADTSLAGRRTAMAQIVTFPPLKVIDYAIDIVPMGQIKVAARSAITDMTKALIAATKR